jgi:myo-inositol-1(or 4)-monophosphatase
MLETAIRAAREAGAVLRREYRRPHDVSVKGFRDIMTEVDLAAERVAVEVVRGAFPGARIMSEESNTHWQAYDDEPAWFIDPLDGTTNFARGLPGFSVSVGVAQGGVLQCGAVYDPLLQQLFWAERGQGAYLDDTRLRVSERASLIDSLAMLDWPREQRMREISARFLARLAPQVDAVRSRGSAALGLCAVAAGWADIYYQYTLGPWDVAAGALIVEEAGGRVTDLHGRPYRLDEPGWLATNGLVHDAVLALEPYS